MNPKYKFLNRFRIVTFVLFIVIAILVGYPNLTSNIPKNIGLVIGFTIIGFCLIVICGLIIWATFSLIKTGISYLRRCPVCRKWAKDILYDGDSNKETPYCRTHLVEQYQKAFLLKEYPAVITEFEPETLVTYNKYSGLRKHPVGLYQYFPLSSFTDLPHATPMTEKILKELLNSIPKEKCNVCTKSAQILFVPKAFGEADLPQESFLREGEFLCRQHAAETIGNALKNAPFNFHAYHGLYLPYKEGGFQTTIFA